jgi:phage terminase small subunit
VTDLVPRGQPDWALLLSDPLDLAAAEAHHARVTAELREAGRWTTANEHAVARLVIAYVIHDRAARQVLEHGVVIASKKTGVPQYSLHFTAMTKAAEVALTLEAELMISPRKRGKTPMKAAARTGPKPHDL